MTRGNETEQQRSPFRRMYINPGPEGKLDDEFTNLYEINFGGSAEGAKRHLELLQRIPEGYEYFGKVSKKDVAKRIQEGSAFIAIDGPVFNLDGKPVKGEVVLARRVVPRNKP